jgi:TatD DNase family protein
MTVRMIDTHCHIDLYPDPSNVARTASSRGVLTIWVTNSPASFERAILHAKSFPNVRVALGLHPLEAHQASGQLYRFSELSTKTSYIGEVGLDFSRYGHDSKEIQRNAFRFVLKSLVGKTKFMTLHSRRAESNVIDLLQEYRCGPSVFHWFSGSISQLERALGCGHFFSINPSMITSKNGKAIVARIPPERTLTETDGPFSKANSRSTVPSDVEVVEKYLGILWGLSRDEANSKIRANFLQLVSPLGVQEPLSTGRNSDPAVSGNFLDFL